jgi:hypothetical protein
MSFLCFLGVCWYLLGAYLCFLWANWVVPVYTSCLLKASYAFFLIKSSYLSKKNISYLHWEIPFLSSLMFIIYYLSQQNKTKKMFKEKGYKLSTLGEGGYIKGSNSENVNLKDPGRKRKKKFKKKKKHLA